MLASLIYILVVIFYSAVSSDKYLPSRLNGICSLPTVKVKVLLFLKTSLKS